MKGQVGQVWKHVARRNFSFVDPGCTLLHCPSGLATTIKHQVNPLGCENVRMLIPGENGRLAILRYGKHLFGE